MGSHAGQVAAQGDSVPQGHPLAGVQRQGGWGHWDRAQQSALSLHTLLYHSAVSCPRCPPSLPILPLSPYSRCCALLAATSHQPARDTVLVPHRATNPRGTTSPLSLTQDEGQRHWCYEAAAAWGQRDCSGVREWQEMQSHFPLGTG